MAKTSRTIAELGGEFALIGSLRAAPRRSDVALGIGDDGAVVAAGDTTLVITTDMLVENDHFTRSYGPPEHTGIKAAASSLSDIAAMGADPAWGVVSLCLTPSIEAEWVQRMNGALSAELEAAGAELVGGDITHGDAIVISVAIVGTIPRDSRPLLRSGARPGDGLWVTGPLGGARAGLRALQTGYSGFDELKALHTAARARLDVVPTIRRLATAAIDVSDGLASEVGHICRASGVGAVVYADHIPMTDATRALARELDEDPLGYALHGGEDLELLFTAPDSDEARAFATPVGEVTGEGAIVLERDGRRDPLETQGFDHFAE